MKSTNEPKVRAMFAMSVNGVIGKDNSLPWHLPSDLKLFKKHTTGNTIVMGRKTFESIGRVLPNRKNVILSSNSDYEVEGADTYTNLMEAVEDQKNYGNGTDLYIIGGAGLIEMSLTYVDELYVTLILNPFEGDVKISTHLMEGFDLTHTDDIVEENGIKYVFCIYTRK